MGDTFICKYSKQKYELTYNYDGMTKTVDIFYQDKIEEFIPFKIGYTFLGWKLNGEIFDKDSYDFSFSGMKSAVLNLVNKAKILY